MTIYKKINFFTGINNNYVKMRQHFVQKNPLYKTKSKSFSFFKTFIKKFKKCYIYVKYVNFFFFYFDNNGAHGY